MCHFGWGLRLFRYQSGTSFLVCKKKSFKQKLRHYFLHNTLDFKVPSNYSCQGTIVVNHAKLFSYSGGSESVLSVKVQFEGLSGVEQ